MPRAGAIALLLFLAGCAGGARDLPPVSPGRGPPAAGDGLFISPAGEPFRGGGTVSPLTLWFDGADADHDGRLTLAEFTADHERFFRSLDLNGDGVLDGQEIARYEQVVAPELLRQTDRVSGAAPAPERGGGRGSRGGGRGSRGDFTASRAPGVVGGGFSYGLLPDSEPVRSADLDLDFKVSLAEWRSAASRRFGQLDANHDAALTLNELHWPKG